MSTLATAPVDLWGVLRALFHGSSRGERPASLHYPPLLNDIVESAALDREMYRL
ncbi:hypothetical protein [Mycobacterium sp. pW045]|jgi:hypothetical protein|uniref:hypothetical protein n=1 Tax=Mycobacterium sp. pW045 TaxID=3238984 RepID=UPI00351AF05B